MGHRHVVICDGCGTEEVTGENGMGRMTAVTVSLKAGPDASYDLCVSCEQRLQEWANPTKWPRVAEAQMEN